MRRPILLLILSGVLMISAACASVPPPPPEPTFADKLAWMLRLEDQRVLRDPAPPPAAPVPARRGAAVAPPLAVPDLVLLSTDPEARVRRRAALAIGRVGLADGIEPLTRLLEDPEPEVRQMAAFALGLIGDAAASPALARALIDHAPIVQGRAAEALAAIGAEEHAPAIADMARPRIGAIAHLAADDLTYPLAPDVEAARLAIYALARLKAYEPLATLVLDAAGRPVSHWWPVAYALRRAEDPRAVPALRELLRADGSFTRGFAARGLGVLKASEAVDDLLPLVVAVGQDPFVAVEAVRAVAELQTPSAVPALVQLLKAPGVHPGVRAEAVTAIGRSGGADDAELLLDLLNDRVPQVRASAFGAIAALDPERLLLAMSGLDPDPDWRVRAAAATAIGTLPAEQAAALLAPFLEVDDDARVQQAALRALAAARAPGAQSRLIGALAAPDPGLRRAAAEGLVTLEAAGAAEPLRRAYEAARGDETHAARAAMLSALARLDRAAAVPVLTTALQDAEWTVRVRAATLLHEIDPARPAAEIIRPAPTRLDAATYASPAVVSPRYSTHVYLETDAGTIQIELAVLDAPLTVHNFVSLARQGFFDGAPVHRVVPAFVVQDGDPGGDGAGGPGWTIRDEINQRPYLRGTVGMALDGRDSGGSQFFITHGPQPHLDGRYTVFGHVVSGMDIVDRIAQGDTIRTVRVWDGG